MIIWINGPFGVGKTQTAYELLKRITESFVYNPEEIGFFTRKRIPKNKAPIDFQDLKVWRTYNKEHLDYIDTDENVVIVPMTLVNREYFKEIIEPLKTKHKILHFSLIAERATIESRLKCRGDGKSWNINQIGRCLDGLRDKCFEEYIDTDKMDLYEVVEHIGKRAGLHLKEDSRSKYHKSFDRLLVTIKNIRL